MAQLDLASTIKTDPKGNKIEQEDLRPEAMFYLTINIFISMMKKVSRQKGSLMAETGTFLFKYF
jgi:hypothetical protein